ncbi:MAG: tRNA uridine-5-carboxymethylaminomethyl(34) synthesis GTPase MnmE [Nitrospinae bacterium]|nr:tRNA uridine-5-carboxymethylaminomethyl(34) synthesis GTPase MnmE [Nitrospinota bacterium]
MDDTIAALATPPGEGGISVIRISGEKALSIAKDLFHSKSDIVNKVPPVQKVLLGEIRDPESGRMIDEVLLTWFKKPNSYTGEDVVEISGHGGALVSTTLLQLILKQGARLAEPGEFTRRAFVLGRLDLTQAEAVADLIDAASERALHSAVSHLKGGLSRRINKLFDQLLGVQAQLEAAIDFSEEGLTFQSREMTGLQIKEVRKEILTLVQSFRHGKIIREGMRVTLVGKPNAGKSSLLNALLQEDRAIVTDIPGTTRDTLEERIRIQDIHIVIIDSAGLRDNPEIIEEEGIQRTRNALAQSDLALVVFDPSQPLDGNDELLMKEVGSKPRCILFNKSDLDPQWQEEKIEKFLEGESPILLSAKTGAGLNELKEAIYNFAIKGERAGDSIAITRERHRDHLQQAATALDSANKNLDAGYSEELLAVDITLAIEHFGSVLGKTFVEDLLDKIFGQFCIGK